MHHSCRPRRLLGWGLVALTATLGACREGPDTSAAQGWWLWSQETEDGTVIRTITDSDMEPAVGPTGWPDCPDGIICTRYGIQKLALSDDGKAHFINNVHTSSDFHLKGSFSVSGDLLTFVFRERFSCAHPDQRDEEMRVRYARWRFGATGLEVSVTGFGSSDPFASAPPEAPTRWLTLRSVSADDYENRFMIRLCQAQDPADCHADCFPERYGGAF